MGCRDQEREWPGGLFAIASIQIPYTVLVNRRRKHPCIIVREKGRLEIESSTPMTEKAITRFLKANEDWILSVLQKFDTGGTFRNGTATIDGEEIPYYITINRKRKRIGITIRDDLGIEIRSPVPLTHTMAESSIEEVSDWIRRHRRKKEALREKMPARQYTEGETILFQGKTLSIRQMESGRSCSAWIQGDELWINLPTGTRHEESLSLIRQAVMDCYTDSILPVAEGIAQRSAEAIGVACPRVRFGYQKRRFGSCTPKNGIIINLRIVMAPPQYLEYTIIHEVCHLVERNHQQRFWDLVESQLPTYKELHDLLQREGMQYSF